MSLTSAINYTLLALVLAEKWMRPPSPSVSRLAQAWPGHSAPARKEALERRVSSRY